MELHDLLGRRYAFAEREGPDFTVVSYNTADDSCYVHVERVAAGEDRGTLVLSKVLRAIKRGGLIESEKAPFVHERVTARRR